jgi:hypothetical protein
MVLYLKSECNMTLSMVAGPKTAVDNVTQSRSWRALRWADQHRARRRESRVDAERVDARRIDISPLSGGRGTAITSMAPFC